MSKPEHQLTTALGTILQPLDLQAAGAAEGDGQGAGPPYEVPDWIPLTPNGPLIQGVDRRTFQMDDPERVIEATRLPIALDWDHGSTTAIWSGVSGKAAARITRLEMRDDGMWGRCQWTAAGRESVEKGEYLYISPTFIIRYSYDDDAPPEIRFLTSAALTNNPNLNTLPALNRQHPYMEPHPMAEENAGAAGAPEPTAPATPADPPTPAAATAADTEIATLRDELAELRRERQEREEARQTELNALRQELAGEREQRQAEQTQQREQAVSAALDKAIADRRITPASRDYFLAQCRKDGGLEEFQRFVERQPEILRESGLGNAPPPPAGAATLTAREKEICANMEIDPEEYLKTKNAEQAQRRGDYPPGL